MHPISLLPILALITTSFAHPTNYGCSSQTLEASSAELSNPSNCLTNAQTDDIINRLSIIFSGGKDYVQLANDLLTEDFTAISDSFNLIAGEPLNTTGSTSREQALEAVAMLAPVPNITSLFVAHTCDAIFWYFEYGRMPLPVRNFGVFFVNEEGRVYKTYRELNSAAALINFDRDLPKNVTVGDEGVVLSKEGCGGYY